MATVEAARPKGTAGGRGGDVTNCVNPMLQVTASTSQGAAGTMVQRFLLKNIWSSACSLHGAPDVVPYGKPNRGATKGADLPLTVNPIPATFGDLGGDSGVLVLNPGQTAVFFLKWSDVPTEDAPCPVAAGFAFRAPVDPLADADKLVPYSFSPCGGQIGVSRILPPSVLD